MAFHAVVQICLSSFAGIRVRHVQRIFRDQFRVKLFGSNWTDCFRVSADGNAETVQDFYRDGACGDTADRLTAGRTSSAAVIPEAIFLIEGIICVSRAIIRSDLSVVAGTLAGIAYDHGDRCSGGPAFENAGEDLNFICFFSGCRVFILTRLSAV